MVVRVLYIFFQVAKQLTKDFCQSTSIHGPAYLVDTNTGARIFWSAALVVGFSLASYFIYGSIIEWQESPVIVSFEDLAKPVFKLRVIAALPPGLFSPIHATVIFLLSFLQSQSARGPNSLVNPWALWKSTSICWIQVNKRTRTRSGSSQNCS